MNHAPPTNSASRTISPSLFVRGIMNGSVDLWLVTPPGTSFDASARPMVSRPLLCETVPRGRSLGFSELSQLVSTFLATRRPHWWLPSAPINIVWRPCAEPAQRLFNECIGAAVPIDTESAWLHALAEISRSMSRRHSSLGQLVLIIGGRFTAEERKREFWRQQLLLKRQGRHEKRAAMRAEPRVIAPPARALEAASPPRAPPAMLVPRSSRALPSSPKRGSQTETAWHKLHACRLPQCAYRCPASSAYAAYLSSLPPLEMSALLLPPRTRLLMYGPSFLGQLADALLCAASAEGTLLGSTSFEYPPTREPHVEHSIERRSVDYSEEVLDMAKSSRHPTSAAPSAAAAAAVAAARLGTRQPRGANYPCCDGGVGEARRAGTLTTHSFARNSSLTLIVNHAPLQRGNSTDALEAFVTSGWRHHLGKLLLPNATRDAFARLPRYFTHLVYMAPHPDCFFDRQRCVDLAADVGDSIGDEAKAGGTTRPPPPAQWRILSAHIRHAFLAFAWRPWRLALQERAWNQSFAPPGYTLTPRRVVHAPCLMPDCSPLLTGHQCWPGATSLESLDIVNALRRTRKAARIGSQRTAPR